jgi:NDP-sugar pyrophosphorylase family protein
MEVAALIVVDANSGDASPAVNVATSSQGSPVPLALWEIFGKSVLLRSVERLQQAGIGNISVFLDQSVPDEALPEDTAIAAVTWARHAEDDLWREAENSFSQFADNGVDAVLAIRLGAYTELDISDLLRFHLDQRTHVTMACDASGPLDFIAINSGRRNDAAFLMRSRLQRTRLPAAHYVTNAYSNRLSNPKEFRALVQDGFLGRCGIRPLGMEIKPGVWVDEHARIHRSARVLAPAYIGAGARVRAAAVITRCSSIEHHAEVDCGTVVEDASILPHTYVGAGLDVAHVVLGHGRLSHTVRNVEVEIADPRLVGTRTRSAPLRTLTNAASLAAYLPMQLFRGLFAPSHREQPSQLPSAVGELSPALNPPAQALRAPAQSPSPDQFPADFAVARRYGDQ